MAVIVVNRGSVVYSGGFGVSDAQQMKPVTPQTAFQIGSLTKSFTATVLGMLDHEGTLSLSSRPSDYIPGFSFSTDRMNNCVTLSDLLSHRSGLGAQDATWVFFPGRKREELLPRVKYLSPQAEPKDSWIYSNMGYILAGAVAEKVTGQTWDDLIRKKILEPLHMASSVTNHQAMLGLSDYSLGYGKRGPATVHVPFSDFTDARPSGSVVSTASDLSHWLIAWTQAGMFEGKQVIPAQYVLDAMTMRAIDNGAPPEKGDPGAYLFGYGYGWKIASNHGHFKVHHGGNTSGFSCQMVIYPSDGLGIAVLTNQDGSLLPYMVADVLTNRMLELPRKAIKEYPVIVHDLSMPATPATAVLNAKAPSHQLAEYTGDYTHPGYGVIRVQESNGILYAVMPGGKYWLEHQAFDCFKLVPTTERPQIASNDFFLNFRTGTDGVVSGVGTDFTAEGVEFGRESH